VARSVAGEQAVTAGVSLLAGCLLGTGMAVAVLRLPLVPGASAALAALVTLALAAAATGALARRMPPTFDPRLAGRRS
jgi:hypothetical protein